MSDFDEKAREVLDMLRGEPDAWDERPPCFAAPPGVRCRDDVDGEGCHHPKVTEERPELGELAMVVATFFVFLLIVALAYSLIRLAVSS